MQRDVENPFTVEEVEAVMEPVMQQRREKSDGDTSKLKGHNQPVMYTPEMITHMLNEITRTGVAETAARAYGLRIRRVLYLRRELPALEDLWQEALDLYRQRVVCAVHRRGVEGWEEPVWYQGQQVGTVRRYSDRMLELQLKKHDSSYHDKSVTDVVHHGGVLLIPAPADTKEEWMRKRGKTDE